MKVHVLGVDLAKNVFQLHGVDRKGRCVLVRRVRRELLMHLIAELDPCLIGIEACTGAFYWQRQFERHGHTVKIIAPQYVKPFVRRQKNDSNDAEADEDVLLGFLGWVALDVQGAVSRSEVEGGVANPTRRLGKDHAELEHLLNLTAANT